MGVSHSSHSRGFVVAFGGEAAVGIHLVVTFKLLKSPFLQKGHQLFKFGLRNSATLYLAIRCAVTWGTLAAKLSEKG